MNIFISHSSQNADYGSALVELLTGIGVPHESIVFTSDTSYGIPTGENIFDWLKSKISEKPFVIYLLSPEYYSSVACLNEMGAAWVIENDNVTIFTPNFDLKSDNFRDGALDPRKIGFYIDDEDRLTGFVEALKKSITLSTNQVLINKKTRDFIDKVKNIPDLNLKKSAHISPPKMAVQPATKKVVVPKSSIIKSKQSPVEKYFHDLEVSKLNNAEIMVIYYAADTAGARLGVGWKAEGEVNNIRGWEELNDLGDTLSNSYDAAINRLDLRNLTKVSETTSHGNPREVILIDEMQEKLLDLPDIFYEKCAEISKLALEKMQNANDDQILF